MKSLLQHNRLWLPLAATCSLLGSQQALSADCVVAIALGSGKDNYVYNGGASSRQIGYWDVDDGGGNGGGNDLGSDYINLSAMVGPMSSQECIEDLRLVAGDWGQQRNAPVGYTEAGWWDIDDAGSGDSNGNSSDGRMTLFVKKMDKSGDAAQAPKVIQDIGMRISDSEPSRSGATNVGDYSQVGWWDVDDATGCGFLQGQESCGGYGGILLVKKAPFVSGEAVTSLVLTGRWEAVNTCRGSQCGETSFQLTVGAEQGKEISKSSTLGKSLSAMLGSEVKGTSGALPGVEATVKVEVTGQMSSEQQDAIMNSFTSSRQSTNAVTCSGPAVMWQWKSSLQIQRVNRVEEVAADSLLTVCAPISARPSHANDIAWDPEVAAVASAPAGARTLPLVGGFDFQRGQTIHSPSGNHFIRFQDDGNLVVNGRAGNHLWGLDAVIPEQLGKIGRLTFQADGNLVAYDAAGGFIWSALQTAQPAGTSLRVNDNGVLEIIRPDNSVAWSSAR